MLPGFHRSEPKGLVVSEIYPHMNSSKEEPPTGTKPTLGLHSPGALSIPAHPVSELEVFG